MKQLGGVTRQTLGPEAKRPRPLPWLGKRLLALAFASGTVGYAFHVFGTWPLGVIAIATPISGWIALILGMHRTFKGQVVGIRSSGTNLPELFPQGQSMNKAAADLAAQMDWKRRFGT